MATLPATHASTAPATLNVELLKTMYTAMLRVRLVEEKIIELYPEQAMRCPVHLSIGQEAVAVGVCSALRPDDAVMSGHRAHAHYLAKGGNLLAMMAEIYGRSTGCCRGRGGSMHLIDRAANFMGSTPIVASTLPIATGVAWAAKLAGRDRVTVAFMGEGAAEEGVWHESLNFAAVHHLPIMYACENNLYSVYTPLAPRQPDRPLWALAAAHGLEAAHSDGNNVLTVYDLATRAVTSCLEGHGPVFLEFDTYRWREHCGPNDDTNLGYRTAAELASWQQKDPIARLERTLRESNQCSDEEFSDIRQRLAVEIDQAVLFAKASPFPQPDQLSADQAHAAG